MKRILTVFLTICFTLSFGMTVFASGSEEQDVYAKYIDGNIEKATAPVEDGEADIVTDDNITVSVTDAPEGAVRLMVVPVPETEKEAWEWITDCLKGTAGPIHTFDIYFEDASGNRVDADGAAVTINCPHCSGTPVVCSLDTDGTVHVLTASAHDKAVTFTTNGSTYYIIAEKAADALGNDVTIKEPEGGDVEISDPNPDTCDDVTITPDPDDGKVVDKVIVKDEDGNEIPVKDNGDGTYTYEQPDGDVTIEVTFKDKIPADSPQTGDNTQMWLWWLLLIVSGGAVITLTVYDRKRRTVNR